MRTEDVAGLAQRLRQRDPEAFAQLWGAQQSALWTLASAAMGDSARAEAALRETIELAWAECDRVSGAPGAWLTAVCGRVLLRAAREARPAGEARAAGLRGWLLAALSRVSEADRILLMLHHLGGLEAEELARLAQSDPKRVRRAIQRVRFAVVELMDEADAWAGDRRPAGPPARRPERRTTPQNARRQYEGVHRDAGRSSASSASGAGPSPLRHR